MLISNVVNKVDNSASTRLLMYVLSHTNTNSKIFHRSYKDIQKDTGVSADTVSRVMKALQDNGAAEYLGDSRWYMHIVTGGSDSYEGDDFYVTADKPFV